MLLFNLPCKPHVTAGSNILQMELTEISFLSIETCGLRHEAFILFLRIKMESKLKIGLISHAKIKPTSPKLGYRKQVKYMDIKAMSLQTEKRWTKYILALHLALLFRKEKRKVEKNRIFFLHEEEFPHFANNRFIFCTQNEFKNNKKNVFSYH